MQRNLMEKRHLLQVQIERLKGLSPLDKLNQGFSFTENEQGKPVVDVHRVQVGQRMKTYVKNGVITSVIEKAEEVGR